MDAETKHFNKTFLILKNEIKTRINFILMMFIREEINENKNKSHQGVLSDDITVRTTEVTEVR